MQKPSQPRAMYTQKSATSHQQMRQKEILKKNEDFGYAVLAALVEVASPFWQDHVKLAWKCDAMV